MKLRFLGWLAVMTAAVNCVCTAAAEPRATAKWTSLFNGKDLTGWTPKIKGHELGDNFARIQGETVLEYERPQLDPNDHDAQKLIKDGNVMLDGGYIALQSESHPIEFRNIEIRTLPAVGLLRTHPTNPRYFTDGTIHPDGSAKAVYLTGSHTWNNLVDMGQGDPPQPFDFLAYLDFLVQHGHNFIRLWAWDSTSLDTRNYGSQGKQFVHHAAPQPWLRTGPGQALDGKPKFDLTQFNPDYFERLRSRVQAAGERGIYVSVMLFEGWGLMHGNLRKPDPGWAWRAHPFHPDNNINGISGEADGEALTGEPHRLGDPALNAIQVAYLRKVVDTVNDCDNVLYEVINEGGHRDWDWWVIKTVRDYEQTKPTQHPIGLTGHGAEGIKDMLASTAEWISPGANGGYGKDPPAWTAKKVSLLDTDHIWGMGGNSDWVWKAFTRGHNPLFMDQYQGAVFDAPDKHAQWAEVRRALGQTRRLAERLNLAAMSPHDELASTKYCLAQPGFEYVVYQPDKGKFTVDLTQAAGDVTVEWFDAATDETKPAETVQGGDVREFTPPVDGPVVLCLEGHPGSHYGVNGLAVQNGWYTHNGEVVWGYVQHNGWWRAGQRPNLTRNAAGEIGPNRTEDLDKLTDAMLRFGYPGFEHNFGLWYDRRRDAHDTAQRTNGNVLPPFLEQPWARSTEGSAWDGLSKYDLTTYNDWYFERLKRFAELCDRKGTILFHNCYMQHALLETQAHYADFPWRPTNCLQDTGMPDDIPAANAFYDVSHPLRRDLHRAYIRKCLDVLGIHTNVVFLCSEEYTGPLSFMEFWLDTIAEWEREQGHDVHVGFSATKDVIDAVMADPVRSRMISTIDLRCWWYESDGGLFAPTGGTDVAGRYAGEISRTTPAQIHRQVKEYRLRHPSQALIHGLPGTRQHAWAALMGGASMLVGQLPYPEQTDPAEYISPELCQAIQPTYDFIRERLASELPRMSPHDDLVNADTPAWCLADPNRVYLVYTPGGGRLALDLSAATDSFNANWFDPRTGAIDHGGTVSGGAKCEFQAPGDGDWVLLVAR